MYEANPEYEHDRSYIPGESRIEQDVSRSSHRSMQNEEVSNVRYLFYISDCSI